MNIFFAISLRAATKYKAEYTKIYSLIESLGHSNLSKLSIESDPDKFYKMSEVDLK